MELDGNIIYILFAIAYVIFQVFSGSKKDKKKNQSPPKSAPKKESMPTSEPKEISSFDDLFEEVFQSKEVKQKEVKPTNKELQRAEEIKKAKEALKKESHRIRPRINFNEENLELVELEDEDNESDSSISDFSVEDINWPKAIITKEILDRKYV